MKAAAVDAGEPAAVRTNAQFFVPATASLQERRPRTLKHGDTFGVFDHNGDALSGPGSPEGIFHRDTRHLSLLYLTVDGMRPLLLSSTARDDNAVLVCDLTNPEITDAEGGRLIAQDLLQIRRTRFLWNARTFERLALHNYDLRPRQFLLRIEFAADFADIFEVRGAERPRRGTSHAPPVEADAVTLAYEGLDGRRRETRLQFEPAPTEIGPDRAAFEVDLAPNQRKTLFLEIRCGVGYGARSPRRAFFASFRDARRALRDSTARAASIASSMPRRDFEDSEIRAHLDAPDTFWFRRVTRFEIVPAGQGVRLRHFSQSAIENSHGIAFETADAAKDYARSEYGVAREAWTDK
jgi:glycogen debranching enzyme